jgi:hypothetical protein
VLDTGSGKTRIAAEVIARLQRAGKLVVAPREPPPPQQQEEQQAQDQQQQQEEQGQPGGEGGSEDAAGGGAKEAEGEGGKAAESGGGAGAGAATNGAAADGAGASGDGTSNSSSNGARHAVFVAPTNPLVEQVCVVACGGVAARCWLFLLVSVCPPKQANPPPPKHSHINQPTRTTSTPTPQQAAYLAKLGVKTIPLHGSMAGRRGLVGWDSARWRKELSVGECLVVTPDRE